MRNYYLALKLSFQIWKQHKHSEHVKMNFLQKVSSYISEALFFGCIILIRGKKGMMFVSLYFWMRYADDVLDKEIKINVTPNVFLKDAIDTASLLSEEQGGRSYYENTNDFLLWFVYHISLDKKKLHEIIMQFFFVFEKELSYRRENFFPTKEELRILAAGWGNAIFAGTFYFFGGDFSKFQNIVGERMYVFQETDWLYGQFDDLAHGLIFFTEEDFKSMSTGEAFDHAFFKKLGNREFLEKQEKFMEWRRNKKNQLEDEFNKMSYPLNGHPSDSGLLNFLLKYFLVPKFKKRLARC